MRLKKYAIAYYCISVMGKVRTNNEDNFFCDGKIRSESELSKDLSFGGEISSYDNKMMAVYDGMGGEEYGELASFIAAAVTKRFCEESNTESEYLQQLCQIINNKICQQTAISDISLMGTTGAMIQFNKKEIFIANIGDSRIYKISGKEMMQISLDHIAGGFAQYKAPLTQFLGLDNADEFEPFIAKGNYNVGDYFLICSDGITDMLSDEEIFSTIKEHSDVHTAAQTLVEKALENGGTDNTTLILCKIFKK